MITDRITDVILTHSTLNDKINALSAIAESLPIVIIVHDLQSQGVIYMSPNGLKILGCTLDPLHHVTSKVNRLLEENNFLRRNQKVFTSLGKREKEILKFMALGNSTAEMAARLFFSEQTVNTHRRNIKAKLNAESNYDIVKFAQSFDLI